MKSPAHRAAIFLVLGGLLLGGSLGALAGGLGEHDDDDDNLRYFGFVKDANGRFVAAAKVDVAIKGSVTLSAVTDATGAYRIPIPRLLPGVAPENITVSCAKAGYRQVRAVTRSNLNQKPLIAVEVECTMEVQR